MVDTHTHLYFGEEYAPDGGGEAAVDRAVEAGVEWMVLPNVSIDSCAPLIALHRARPEVTEVAVGLHPEDVDKDWRAKVREVFDRFEGVKPVAVGEVGLDLYHDDTFRFEQMDAFGEQLERARAAQLPVIIHSREALEDTLTITGSMGGDCPPLLFHSFTMGPDEAARILERHPDALFGINGVVTFKNAPLVRDAVKMIGIDRIVLETDAPYLSPAPLRGRRNESAFLTHINNMVAEQTGLTPEESDRLTTANAARFFRRS